MSGRPIKRTLRHVPLSHPFVERLIGTMRRECLDHVLFWNAGDLERKLADFQAYYNAARSHASLEGYTPLGFAGERAGPCRIQPCALDLPLPGHGPASSGGLMTNSRPTGKTHLALALGLAACQKGYRVRFTTTAALVNELLEARDDKRLLRVQKQLVKQDLLIVDELGYVPLSKTGAELLFEIFSQRYEQASTLVTSNLPFNEWTEIFGSERLTGALLDRLTHHVHILELNGESYRLEHSKKARPPAAAPAS